MDFDKIQWASGHGNADGVNPRVGMVSAAEKAGVKAGANRTQVRALLGKPDGEGPDGDVWFLGQSQIAPDYLTLNVDYNPQGIVTKVYTKQT